MADFEQYIIVKVTDKNLGSDIRRYAREAGAEGHLTVSSDKAWLWESKNFFAEVEALYEQYMAESNANFLKGDLPQSRTSAQRDR